MQEKCVFTFFWAPVKLEQPTLFIPLFSAGLIQSFLVGNICLQLETHMMRALWLCVKAARSQAMKVKPRAAEVLSWKKAHSVCVGSYTQAMYILHSHLTHCLYNNTEVQL